MENFALAQTIAAGGCGAVNEDAGLGIPNTGTKEVCGWAVGETVIWYESVGSNCNLDVGDKTGDLCYDNPDGGITIFANS